MKHQVSRIRHDPIKRTLVVRRTEYLTPHMLRVTLEGDELSGFNSPSPDDHIKVFAPNDSGEMERRDYTPRRYDLAAGELAIDFALHDGGPVTAWARNVKPGAFAQIAGPRGSLLVPHDFDWWLLIGDETALPAIGRRIEELPAGTPVISVVLVSDKSDEQQFATKASHEAIWVHRVSTQVDDPLPLLAALQALSLPKGEGFIWIAAEATVARALKRHVVDTMHHPTEWLKASGYWVKGRADSAEKLD